MVLPVSETVYHYLRTARISLKPKKVTECDSGEHSSEWSSPKVDWAANPGAHTPTSLSFLSRSLLSTGKGRPDLHLRDSAVESKGKSDLRLRDSDNVNVEMSERRDESLGSEMLDSRL